MLTYHQAFDVYNCAFRMLLIADHSNRRANEVERLRIWDFYYTFPAQARNIRFTRDLFSARQSGKAQDNPYKDLVDPKMVFERMRPYQTSAIRYLFAKGFFEGEYLFDSMLVRSSKPIPKELKEQMKNISGDHSSILYLVSSPLNALDWYGPNGLKARTKLIDFRYDPN